MSDFVRWCLIMAAWLTALVGGMALALVWR